MRFKEESSVPRATVSSSSPLVCCPSASVVVVEPTMVRRVQGPGQAREASDPCLWICARQLVSAGVGRARGGSDPSVWRRATVQAIRFESFVHHLHVCASILPPIPA